LFGINLGTDLHKFLLEIGMFCGDTSKLAKFLEAEFPLAFSYERSWSIDHN